MRSLAFALLIAACSSKSGGTGDDDGGGIDAPTGPAEACAETVESYCSRIDCDGSPADARADSKLCPSDEVSCLDVVIVGSTMPDGGVNLYYQNGVLIAIEDITIIGTRCVAGPPMFAPPNCGATQATPLAVCAHSP